MSWMQPPEAHVTRRIPQLESSIFGPPEQQNGPTGRKPMPTQNSSSIVFMSDGDLKDYASERSKAHAALAEKHRGAGLQQAGVLSTDPEPTTPSPSHTSVALSKNRPQDQFHLTANLPEAMENHPSITVTRKGQASNVLNLDSGSPEQYDEFRRQACARSHYQCPGKQSADVLANPNYGYDKNYGFDANGFKPTDCLPSPPDQTVIRSPKTRITAYQPSDRHNFF
ncbi:hypothetical protein GMRT_16345 [Giardia muris]|uniref:Uncharacterized protein n=1 Tax=Giardia muris TaxID=5742 RepID=A0A4Z1SUX8_GIAMU|nr:hypothetical protein GMRT_16345 [Giardia muris]|eukprot:TNJ29692.1 hypothetical protein GMRT_16345 [Giardia muris]